MASKTSVTGQDKLFKALKKLETKISNQILRTELRAGAKEMAVEIKATAPTGETKMLKRSIRVRSAKRRKGRIGFVATTDAKNFPEQFYSSFVELGTKKQPAQHFEKDAFDKLAPELAHELPQRIWKQIESSTKGGK